jgi:hypothetical protein
MVNQTPTPKKPRSKARHIAVQTRLTDKNHKKLQKKAETEGLTISSFLRQLILRELR